LRENCGHDADQLKAMLADDIAVVFSQTGNEQRLNTLFQEVGLFLFKGEDALRQLFADNSPTGFAEVYFTRADFINTPILDAQGVSLTFAEKSRLFDKAFYRITVKKPWQSISASSVGQYIFKIYDVLLHGMSIAAFKAILFSNWEYATRGGAKWDAYLAEFKILEVFFEKKTSLAEWLDTADSLRLQKDAVDADEALCYHPLRTVSADSLLCLCTIFCS
jgi:hypothetical protein